MFMIAAAGEGVETAFWWIAILSTALFAVKMLLSFIGGGLGADFDADAFDIDFDADALDIDVSSGVDVGGGIHHDGSLADLKFLSVQSLLAFLMGTGWMALTAMRSWEFNSAMSVLCGLAFGFALMALNAYLMSMACKLNASGTVRLNTCQGAIGRVYLRIPEYGEGAGRVEVVVSGRKRIVPAVSTGPAIESFTPVRIVEVRDNREVVVQPKP